MIKLLSAVIKHPVVTAHLSEPIGVVADYILDAEKGIIAGYVVIRGRQKRYVSTVDVIRYYDDAVEIRDPANLQTLQDLIRLRPLVQANCSLTGSKVVDESGKRLGHVQDAAFESTDHSLASIYVKPGLVQGLFGEERILARNLITRIERHKVTVRYDREATPPAATPEIAS